MELITCSAIVSYFTKVEKDVANLYEKLAETFPEHKETFLTMEKESKSNIVLLERSYYGVISDKLEACFIKQLNTDNYNIEVYVPSSFRLSEALEKVITMEENIQRFVSDAAKSISALVPDVSWTLSRVSKKRTDRINKLKALRQEINK
ncbi:MAG: hypothetical protein QW717_04590 [Candidatus Bathyarchaeia archaeon]